MGIYKQRVSVNENIETLVQRHKQIAQNLKTIRQMKKSVKEDIINLKSSLSSHGDEDDISEVDGLTTAYNNIFNITV